MKSSVIAGVVVSALLAGCGVGFAQASPHTKPELANMVRNRSDSIRDLYVSFSFDAVQAPPHYAHHRYWATVMQKGDKILVDSSYGPDLAFRQTTFNRVITFNGERSTTFEVHSGFARVEDGRSGEARTNGLGFFDLAMLNPPADGGGYDDVSLLSLLESVHSSVRPQCEEVQGRQCDVVDFHWNGAALMTVWIDAERGCLPLQWVLRPKHRPEHVLIEFRVEEAAEIASGIWLPMRGTKQVHALGTGRPHDVDLEFRMEVHQDANGAPLLRVNVGLDDRAFDLWQSVPGGTEVWDVNTDNRWIAFSSSPSDSLPVLYAAIDVNGIQIPPTSAVTSASLSALGSLRRISPKTMPGTSRYRMRSRSLGDAPPRLDGQQFIPCGPAALALCLELIGVSISEQGDLASLADDEGYTTLDEIARWADGFGGLHVYAGRLSPEQLRGIRHPALIYLNWPALGNDLPGHFAVYVCEADRNAVFVFDPTGQTALRGPVSLETLSSLWSGIAMVITREPIPALESPASTAAASEHAAGYPQAIMLCMGINMLGLCAGSIIRR